MMRLPLRAQLTIWFAASILLILGPLIVGLLVLEWRSMRTALDHHLREDLEVAAEMLVADSTQIRWRIDGERDPGYDDGVQRWVEVYGLDGSARFLRGFAKESAIRTALLPPSSDTLGYQTIRTPAGAFVRVLTSQRRLGSEPVRIRVARSEDAVRGQLRRLAWLFGLTSVAAIVAAAVAGYVIAGRALAPLARMAERARSISAEHLSERLPVENTQDEVGRLALVFNATFERLEASFRHLKQFTADASHELRTPLTAIRSVGEVGLRERRDAKAYQDIIGSMLEEVDRLSRVVDTLLTLSRWDDNGAQIVAEEVDLHALARDVASQLSVLADDRSVTIATALHGSMVVKVDPVRMRQAVVNVVDNAIKFTREGGRVQISSCAMNAEWQLIVDDEGPGIPVEERDRVLQRFYRVEGRGDLTTAGAGLGLAIVQRAMLAHGGSVHIQSNSWGGARILLSLPKPARS